MVRYAAHSERQPIAVQPTFVGPSSPVGHPCSGYNENQANVVHAQQTQMIWQGQGGSNLVVNCPDWYGNKNGGGFLEATIAAYAADALTRITGPASGRIYFCIMLDKGALTSGMNADSGINAKAIPCAAPASPPAAWSSATAYAANATVMFASVLYIALSANTNKQPDTNTTIWETNTTCVINGLKADLDHIDGLSGNQAYYAPTPITATANAGHHELLTFLIEGDFLSVNWGTVWSTIASYQAKYKVPYDIFHWRGNFIEANQAGAYMWPQSLPYDNANPSTQYAWDQNNGYQKNFYTAAQDSTQTPIVGLFIGYDGSNNNYNNRLMSRMCGNTLLLNSRALLQAQPRHYSNTFPLPAFILPTWNDLGEATNIEGGVDNCWRTTTPSYFGTTLTFGVTAFNPSGDFTGLTVNTIDHFEIMFGDGTGPLFPAQDNITPTAAGRTGTTTLTCSFDLSTATMPPIPGHNWFVYVKAVGTAIMLNETNGGTTGNQMPAFITF
jgi:hypothetical protein